MPRSMIDWKNLCSLEASSPVLEPWQTSSGCAVQFPHLCMQTSITRIGGEVSKTEQSDVLSELLSASDIHHNTQPVAQWCFSAVLFMRCYTELRVYISFFSRAFLMVCS